VTREYNNNNNNNNNNNVRHVREDRKVYKVLVGKPEGKRPLEGLRRRWEVGIRMDLRETGWGDCGLDSTGSR
jgi:hypothetical protein